MHLIEWNILFYLSFHVIGGLLAMASALGIPGDIDDSKPLVKKVSTLFNVLLNLGWSGIPILLLGALVAFYFEEDQIGKILSCISLSLGVSLCGSLIALYKVK